MNSVVLNVSDTDAVATEGVASPSTSTLLPCLARLAQLQQEVVDRLAVQEAAVAATAVTPGDARAQLEAVANHLQVKPAKWLSGPDASRAPALLHFRDDATPGNWGVLRGQNAQQQWVSEWWNATTSRWTERLDATLPGHAVATFRLSRPYTVGGSPVYRLIRDELFAHRRLLRDAVIGGAMINLVALVTSFYSMQVYDRVVPTQATQTLLVLTLGVLAALVFDFTAKHVRSRLHEQLVDHVDQRLARTVYLRFLSIRLDQLPQSVGGLAAQMRGYEAVRGFFTTAIGHLLVDAPFALLFALVIALIGGWLAVIPLVFFLVCTATGLYYRRRVDALAFRANAASNQKTGLLVETIEGAESIKSGQGGWRMLGRWMKTTDEARDHDLQMRAISEHSQHLAGTLQQLSYTLLVAAGALMVSHGELTLGGLLACSILSGRVLAPVSLLPGQFVQWAHARAGLLGLDRLWALQDDHHGQEQPVLLGTLRGDYRLEEVVASYGANRALSVPQLIIRPGEKVGILGPIGAGKTTLLRLLSGMYKPQAGRVLLDDIDIAHLSKPLLAEHMGYVQQEGRLFAGTLRDNLILGQLDPGDEAILQAARRTGLLGAVVAAHPKGLQQPIFEGGTGLSGGQRQLVNLTRAFLRRPNLWLLDEPTASMDRALEQHVMRALRHTVRPTDTLVLVTHKLRTLDLVERVIVVSNHQVLMDGPKAQVLHWLRTRQGEMNPAGTTSGASGFMEVV